MRIHLLLFLVLVISPLLGSSEVYNVAVRGDTPEFIHQKENGEFDGYIYEILQHIEKELHVTFKLSPFTDVNGTWDELLNLTSIGRWDFSAGSFSITVSRMEKTLFSHSFFTASRALLVRKTEATHIFSLLQPFSHWLWVALGGALLLMAAGVRLAEYHNIKRYSDGMWFVVVLLFGPPNPHPHKRATRATVVVWEFCFLVLVAAYTAKLASMLTIERASSSITSFADVVADPVGVTEGTSNQEYATRIGLRKLEYYPVAKATQLLLQGRVKAFLAGTTQLRMEARKNCKVGIATTADVHQYGFAFPKSNSELAYNISMEIVKLTQSGILEALQKVWFPPPNCQRSVNDPFTVHDFAGVFVLIAAGEAILLGAVVYRKLRHLIKHHVLQRKKSIPQLCSDIPSLLAAQQQKWAELQRIQEQLGQSYLSQQNELLQAPPPTLTARFSSFVLQQSPNPSDASAHMDLSDTTLADLTPPRAGFEAPTSSCNIDMQSANPSPLSPPPPV